jgi:UDP-glucose 4-epimerase
VQDESLTNVECKSLYGRKFNERNLNESSDENPTKVGRTKVATMATLSLVTLQQQWHYNAQRYYCYNAAGVRNNAATTTRCDATAARYDAV